MEIFEGVHAYMPLPMRLGEGRGTGILLHVLCHRIQQMYIFCDVFFSIVLKYLYGIVQVDIDLD